MYYVKGVVEEARELPLQCSLFTLCLAKDHWYLLGVQC